MLPGMDPNVTASVAWPHWQDILSFASDWRSREVRTVSNPPPSSGAPNPIP
jgi:hypothetical protein